MIQPHGQLIKVKTYQLPKTNLFLQLMHCFVKVIKTQI